MSAWDVVVVGGGSAGIAAARRLHDAGKRVLIVEAGSRLGGRAHTVRRSGVPMDLGCTYLHSAELNPFVGIADAGGFTVDRREPGWTEQWRGLGFPAAEQEAAYAAFAAWHHRLETDPPASDCGADALEPGNPWNAYIDALSGYMNGAGVNRLSAADYIAYESVATEHNWRVREGYGTLVTAQASGIAVALATPVDAIDLSGHGVKLFTERGTIEAEAAIVTVSTNVLAAGNIALPSAYDDLRHAASLLPLGDADKLFLAVDGDGLAELEDDTHLIGNPRSATTGAYMLKPLGRPVIDCFFGGEGARAGEALGLDGAAAFAIEELAGLFGSGWRKRLRLIAGSSWARHDHILGAYSHALPGHHGARRVLRRDVDPRLRFAGEACHDTHFSTCHGAWETGVAAAEAVLNPA